MKRAHFTEKVVYSSANPAPESGKYTIIIPPPTQEPLTPATATASVAGGKITAITLSNYGTGYTNLPSVSISGTAGKGATARAYVTSQEVTRIVVTNGGSGYSGPITVTIDPPVGLPQGTGWATMSVNSSGAVSISGKLGDGTSFSAGCWLNGNYYWYGYYYGNYANAVQTFPFFANVYSAPVGYVMGSMTFEDITGVSDFDGGLDWYKPQQTSTQLYANGFQAYPMMIGSVYVDPVNDAILTLSGTVSNAGLTLTAGNLPAQLQNSLLIAPTPKSGVTVVTGSSDALSMACSPSNGSFSGKFLPTPTAKSTFSFGGVVFQKQNIGVGVFTGTNESGNVVLTPQ